MPRCQKGDRMGLIIEEQETHVNFNRNEERAVIYTSDTTTMTKLDRLASVAGTEWRLEGVSALKGDIIGKTYSCPKEFISFRSKRVERNLSDGQRKALAENLRKVRADT